jgi:hypothetical protein
VKECIGRAAPGLSGSSVPGRGTVGPAAAFKRCRTRADMAAMTLIFEIPGVVAASWYPEVDAVRLRWRSRRDSAGLRAALDRGLKHVTQLGITGWIVDTGGARMPMNAADQAWVENDWEARAAASPLRALLTVAPSGDRPALTAPPQAPDGALQRAEVASLPEALDWLERAALAVEVRRADRPAAALVTAGLGQPVAAGRRAGRSAASRATPASSIEP